MTRLGIVMPVFLQNEVLLQMTCASVGCVRTTADARLYVLANRLTVASAATFATELSSRCGLPVRVTGGERGVAASWNEGARQALGDGAERLLILANDVFVEPDAVDALLAFGSSDAHRNVAVWSGVPINHCPDSSRENVSDGCDFSCCMVRAETLARHGWFDENFWPAYFEDNDYYARVVLGGDQCAVVHAARHVHRTSQTIEHDPEVRFNVRNWFSWNKEYFCRKWGVGAPLNSREEVRAHYYPHPWNDPEKPLSWWPPV